MFTRAILVQSVEQLICNQSVVSSNLTNGTINQIKEIMFEVGSFNFNHKNIALLVNAESKVGLSPISTLRDKFPELINKYRDSKLEVGKLEIIEANGINFFLIPYKKYYKDIFDYECYINIASCLKDIEKVMKNNTQIKDIFFYKMDIEQSNWFSISSIINWYLLLTQDTTIITTEYKITRLDRELEVFFLDNLETVISNRF